MFKKLFIISSVVMLSACSSVPLQKTEDAPTIKTEFLGGSIKVSYDKSTATLRARKQIVEFMKTEIESEKFSEAIFDTLQKSEVANKDKSSEVNHNISQAVRQSIRQKSNGILKGTYVSEKVYDDSTKTVRVIVRSSDQDVEVAKRVSRMMGN